MAFGMTPSFNEPRSNDPTSAPPEGEPQTAGMISPVDNPLASILGKKKRNPRAPAALAQAIAKSKRAYQSKRKWG